MGPFARRRSPSHGIQSAASADAGQYRPAPPTTTKPKSAQIALVAARGPCWLSVRAGSETGRFLYERTLAQGQSVRFPGTRLWIRLGAPWNLDAMLNGKRVQLPGSIANVVVTPSRLVSAH
jgi:hypothetical protein